MKPRIAIVIPGGIGTGKNNIGIPVLEQTIKRLSNKVDVTVFQLFPLNSDYKANDLELVLITSDTPIIRSLKFLNAFRKAHRQKKFTSVHAFWAFPCGFLSVIAGKLFQLPTLVSLQGGDAVSIPEIQYGQLLQWWRRRLVFWTLKNCTHLISPTQYLVDQLKKNGFKRNDVQLIPLGVDTNYFSFKMKVRSSPFNFLHIGNFNKVKDQSTLIKAFKQVRDKQKCKLTLIGEGSEQLKIESIVKDLHLENEVFFRSEIPNAELREYYYEADALLHTSLSEGHPIVVEEAMSCGVLVCGTKVGLLYDLPECCLAVPVGDHGSLGYGILKLINDPAAAKNKITSAFEWANNHSMNWTVDQFMKLYASNG